jgi:amino acid adenylation domain-containing protein
MSLERTCDVTVPELVAGWSAYTPDAPAVIDSQQSLSYEQLDARANRLAYHLRALGAGSGSIVAICLHRSTEMVVAALGVMKAGAAYLPLDPSSPPERLAFTLRDAGVEVLISDGDGCAAARVIRLEAAGESLGSGNRRPPLVDITGAHLAYVIYTSGSTGQPKGVEVTHANLMHLVDWHQRCFGVAPSDRVTQIASPAFDAAVWELWPYLTSGVSVHIPDEETRMDPRLLRDWLVSQRITITFLPTPMAETVMTMEWPATTALRLMLTGGDTLHRYPPASLPFALINNYGPTETTVVATSGVVPAASAWTSPPSIGRPIAGARAYVLDEKRQPVLPGMVGELYVGGKGVARGYLNRPELTAERFVPDPFAGIPEARMYRTGDLVRARVDGELEFMGRSDNQVKIRGYRIELGEIEATLASHPQIQQAVVLAREDSPGDKRLVAYLVPAPDAPLEIDALRAFLGKHLPDYMVPATFVVLPALPMTTNGKVDREALSLSAPALTLPPEPGRELDPREADAWTAAQAEAGIRPIIEQRTASMVATLLKVEQVSPEENFFLLGGHSLLAAQLLVHVHEAFGVDLPLRTLFEQPTISGLSAEIERALVASLQAMSDEEAERLLA